MGRIATDRSIGPTTDNISFGLISADEWVDEIVHKSEEEGDNIVIEMNSAAWKMKAKQQGDSVLQRELIIPLRCGNSLAWELLEEGIMVVGG